MPGLGDLLCAVDAGAFAALPKPQRVAVDRILLRQDANSAPTNQRAVSAAFLAVVEGLAEESAVMLAAAAAQQAMAEHDRLPMPFEHAGTRLLLGQRHALSTIEALNTPLWADRVRAELARTNVART